MSFPNHSRIASIRGMSSASATMLTSFVRPIASPNHLAIMKFGSTTPWYLVLCFRFHPSYMDSWPTMGRQISNVVKSTKPQQWPSGQPFDRNASPRDKRSSSRTIMRTPPKRARTHDPKLHCTSRTRPVQSEQTLPPSTLPSLLPQAFATTPRMLLPHPSDSRFRSPTSFKGC